MYSMKQKAQIILNSSSSKCEKTTQNFVFNPKAVSIERDHVNLSTGATTYIDSINHGLVNGDIVQYTKPSDGTIIQPLTDGTKYVVKFLNSSQFQLCTQATPTVAIDIKSKGGVSDITNTLTAIIENNSARLPFNDYEYEIGLSTKIDTEVDAAATDLNIDRYDDVSVNDLLCIDDQIVKITGKNASPNISIERDKFDTSGGDIDVGTELTQLKHVGNAWAGSVNKSKPNYSHDNKYIHFYEPSNSLAVDDYLEINDEVVKIKSVWPKNVATVTPALTIPAQDSDTEISKTEFNSAEYAVGDLLVFSNAANKVETVQIKAIGDSTITVERKIEVYGTPATAAQEFASGVAITVRKYEKYEIERQQFKSAS